MSSFYLFILFRGFSRKEYLSGLWFPSGPHSVRPLHHDPSVLGGPTWHGLVHWVRQGCGPCDQIGKFSVIVVSVCLPSDALSQHLPLCHSAAAKSVQSCPTLCDPTDISPPGSPVPGTLQARTLEWVAISFSNAWKWKVKVKSLCRSQLLATPWTTAYQAPPPMGFSRQEYWSGVPLPSPPLYHRRPLTEKIGYNSLINQLLLSITCQSRNQ